MKPLEMLQCGYCHRWHWPEELDGDGECETCINLRESRQIYRQLVDDGYKSLAATVAGSISRALIASNRKRAAEISLRIFATGLDRKEATAV